MIVDGCKKLRQQLEKVAKAEANEKIVEQLNLRKKGWVIFEGQK